MQKAQTRNAQHTPGPWLLRCNGIFNTNTNPALLVAEIPNLRLSGNRQRTDHDEEQANARFIVTACNSHADLLAALERSVTDASQLRAVLQFAISRMPDNLNINEWLEQASRIYDQTLANNASNRAAIARATGDELRP